MEWGSHPDDSIFVAIHRVLAGLLNDYTIPLTVREESVRVMIIRDKRQCMKKACRKKS